MDPFSLMQQQQTPQMPPMPGMMGGMGGGMGQFGPAMGTNGAFEGPQDPFAPSTDPTQGVLARSQQMPMGPQPAFSTGDPVADQMAAMKNAYGPRKLRNVEKAPPAPDEGIARTFVTQDKRLYMSLLVRMARDLSLLRQDEAGVPMNWKRARDPQYISPVFSTLVNKFSNLLGAMPAYPEVQYTDMATERDAQTIEDYCDHCRKYEKRVYAMSTGSGNLQRDEFWYLLAMGRLAARVLPDFQDRDYPYDATVLDPATVFVTWGSNKEGILRVTREFKAKLSEVVGAFGRNPKDIRGILKKLGYDDQRFMENYNQIVTVREYWDKWYRIVWIADTVVLKATRHHLGVVPFIYVMAVGEPHAINTPGGMYTHLVDATGTVGAYQVSSAMDLEEKGVSVYHYLINTKNIQEAINTILMIEVEKVRNPPKITYQSPHLFGEDQDPFDAGIGGENFRMLGLQKIEGLPTSPHPTDLSPLLQDVQQQLGMAGNLEALAGMSPQSQTSGFALQNMIATALDLIKPYKGAWEMYQSLKQELKIKYYRDLIAPLNPITVGHREGGTYGQYSAAPLTVDVIERVGTMVDIRLSGIAAAEWPQQVAATIQAMAGGILSQRAGMNRMEIRNPDQMFSEILTEKAMQHPMIQDLMMIPNALISQGLEQMARMWADMVIAPQLAQFMGAGAMGGMGMMGGSEPAAPGGGGAGGGAVLPPDQGTNPTSPGGPEIGQGRGPAA